MTISLTIKGMTFEIAAPYAAGHVINEAEAKALNQTRKENIGNSVRKTVEEIQGNAELSDEQKLEKATAFVAEYDSEYIFTLRTSSGGRRVADPLGREVLAIAKQYIKEQLAARGKTVKEMGEDWIAEKLEMLVQNEKIIALAKKRIAERSKLDLDLE